MRVLDLFSGIGGFSLGLERAGMQTVAFCEIDPFCRRVLAKHWPSVPIFEDVRTLKGSDVEAADVICGGFPCQDISVAGSGAGLAGERSGLWREYARLVGEVRPAYVIVENVAALLGRGMGVILGDLARIGYDAEWRRISAADVGAPHLRERIWIVAYPSDGGQRLILQSVQELWSGAAADAGRDGEAQPMAHANLDARDERRSRDASQEPTRRQLDRSGIGADTLADTRHEPAQVPAAGHFPAVEVAEWHSWWATEPDVGRVAHGVPSREDRLRGLGNAVVPKIPEAIGRAIMTAHNP